MREYKPVRYWRLKDVLEVLKSYDFDKKDLTPYYVIHYKDIEIIRNKLKYSKHGNITRRILLQHPVAEYY